MGIYISVLGSGAALPINSRRCSAQVVNVHGFKLLLDCAEGTQDQVRNFHVRLQSLSNIFISHLHGDHFFGLPGLLSTMHLCGRTEPVTVVAPVGAREAVETLFDRTGNHHVFDIDWHELDFGEGMRRVFANEYCTVDAFPLVHTVPTYGYRITEVPGITPLSRVYTYCCDTMYDESLVPYMQDSDLLCLECTFADEMAAIAADRRHLTAGQAARLASLAGARHLLLSHISARYRDPKVLFNQASAHYENPLLAFDGMRLGLTSGGHPLVVERFGNKREKKKE